MQTADAREQMIEQQVRAWDVLDERVLGIFRKIPRDHFAPADQRYKAYMDLETSAWSLLIYPVVFIIKMCAFIVLFIWVRWTLPRFRYDQLMGLGWKYILPISLVNIVFTGLVLALVG